VQDTTTEWGKYASAIERWQNATGQAPPSPVADGKLSPAFVEWMMGYPEGWIADLPRTTALKALGNAILPLQAATAWAHLLGMGEQEPQPEDDQEELLPTPTAWLGRRPGNAEGDPVRWTTKGRSRELSDFVAWIQEDK
jgi:DNA (cytosine-5)-methyltransferase 1